jgi:trehalose-6-phosphate synthase
LVAGGISVEASLLAARPIMRSHSNRLLSVEQLEELAVAKYIEAALTPDGEERRELLEQALDFANRAKMKSWLMGELQSAPNERVLH